MEGTKVISKSKKRALLGLMALATGSSLFFLWLLFISPKGYLSVVKAFFDSPDTYYVGVRWFAGSLVVGLVSGVTSGVIILLLPKLRVDSREEALVTTTKISILIFLVIGFLLVLGVIFGHMVSRGLEA